jgi:hypothetical protein
MAPNDGRISNRSTSQDLLRITKTTMKQGLALSVSLLLTVSGFAQQTAPPVPPPEPDNSPVTLGSGVTVNVPAGTRIALILTQPIQTRYLHHGDDVYAQTTSPVAVGSEVVIPPGTFVQGKFDRLDRNGSRGVLHLQSMGITSPTATSLLSPGPSSCKRTKAILSRIRAKAALLPCSRCPLPVLGSARSLVTPSAIPLL